jgi:hypothetical protein
VVAGADGKPKPKDSGPQVKASSTGKPGSGAGDHELQIQQPEGVEALGSELEDEITDEEIRCYISHLLLDAKFSGTRTAVSLVL